MEEILGNQKKVRSIIISELQQIKKKYAQPRRSLILYDTQPAREEAGKKRPIIRYTCFFREGYFKKITPSLCA